MGRNVDFNSKFGNLNNVLETLDRENDERIRAALKKMEDFMIAKGVAMPANIVKRMNRINIKGTDPNGKERRLQNEIEEKYGVDILEDSEGYNTLFPLFDSGVIMCRTKELGSYYTQFDVLGQDEEYFDLEIREYRFYNEVFYLHYLVLIEGISKKTPICETRTGYSGIEGFFLKHFSKKELKDFTNEELRTIERVVDTGHNELNVDAITSYTLSIFRIVNFLYEQYEKNTKLVDFGSTFYDNDYFAIRNWNSPKDTHHRNHSEVEIEDEKYFVEILQCENDVKILKTNTIERIMKKIVQQADINTFYSAVGFAFSSGLDMMKTIFDTIKSNKGSCEMIIGSLQKYDDERANNKIDRNTVKKLNELIHNRLIQLYTYEPAFYHGKFYYMSNDKKAFVIIGSSNISKTAFTNNYEMDIIHVFDKGSERDKQFLDWYINLRDKCDTITILDEQNFGDYNWTSELDAYHSLKNQHVSKEEIKKRIEQLSDKDTRLRLNLWMAHNPTDIYEDIDIESLNDYVMFVFAANKLVVFESFIHGNAFYVFRYRNSIVDLMSEIATMTKTQMMCSVHYVNRGYHVQGEDKLMRRINRFFS